MWREGVAPNTDVNVFFIDAREFKLQDNGVLIFIDVYRRREAGGCERLFRAFGAIRLTEKTVHAVHAALHGRQALPLPKRSISSAMLAVCRSH
jgi:hypothetical protein